jgi:hypothetical protein
MEDELAPLGAADVLLDDRDAEGLERLRREHRVVVSQPKAPITEAPPKTLAWSRRGSAPAATTSSTSRGIATLPKRGDFSRSTWNGRR